MNTYEIKVERDNQTYNFRIWSEEALGGDWCISLDVPLPAEEQDEVFVKYDHIHPSWPDGSARYFPSDYIAFGHLELMIKQDKLRRKAEQEEN